MARFNVVRQSLKNHELSSAPSIAIVAAFQAMEDLFAVNRSNRHQHLGFHSRLGPSFERVWRKAVIGCRVLLGDISGTAAKAC
jgi:hypothetical protein